MASAPSSEAAALLYAAERGAIQSMREWASRGGDINGPIGSEMPSPLGPSATPLQWAAFHGHAIAVRSLLECGARDFRAPHAAARQGHSAVLEALIEWGLDPNAADEFGQTPLHYAAAFGQVPCIRQLLRGGANPTLREVSGRTAADLAAAAGYLDAAAVLNQHAAAAGGMGGMGGGGGGMMGPGGGGGMMGRTAFGPTGFHNLGGHAAAGAGPRYPLPGSPVGGGGMGMGMGMGGGFAVLPPGASIGGPGLFGQQQQQQQQYQQGQGPAGMPPSAWAWKMTAGAGGAGSPGGGFEPAAGGGGGGYGGGGYGGGGGGYGGGPMGMGMGAGQGNMGVGMGMGMGMGGFADTSIAHQLASSTGAFGGASTLRPAPASGTGTVSSPPPPLPPGQPPQVVLADARARLRDWLTSIGMLYALPALISAGYDDLDFLASCGLSETDVDGLGITAPGHRRKLLHLYNIDQYSNVAANRNKQLAAANGAGAGAGDKDGKRAVSPVSAPGEGGDDEGEEDGEEEEEGEGDGEEEGEEEGGEEGDEEEA